MTDLFIVYITSYIISVRDAENNELWQGDVIALDVLRILAQNSIIGLLEGEDDS